MDKIDTEKAIRLIYGEILILEHFNDADQVIKLKDKFHWKNKLCLIIEFCNGGNLTTYVRQHTTKGKKMELPEIKFFGYTIAKGLKELHKRNIVHRDIKPDNILLIKNQFGQVINLKICDLGLSKLLASTYNQINKFQTVAGSKFYMAPEMNEVNIDEDLPLNEKVDVYSFGLILFYLMVGKNAYDIIDKKEFNKGNINIPQDQSFHEILVKLINGCLIRDPQKRLSMDAIVQHDFFTLSEIKTFPFNNINPSSMFKARVSDHSVGFVDQNQSIWMKLFPFDKNNQEIIIITQKEIDYLIFFKNIENIVQLLGFGYIEGFLALYFPYSNGRSLEDLYKYRKANSSQLNNGIFFSLNEIKCVARGLIHFINLWHRKNLLHKNLIPKHILLNLDQNGYIKNIKISGFNNPISFENLSYSGCSSNDYVLFMDPYILHKKQNYFYNEISDLWSIGMIIYFMLYDINLENNAQNLLTCRENGEIKFPMLIDESIQSFILFCIRKSKQDINSKTDLIDELKSQNIKL